LKLTLVERALERSPVAFPYLRGKRPLVPRFGRSVAQARGLWRSANPRLCTSGAFAVGGEADIAKVNLLGGYLAGVQRPCHQAPMTFSDRLVPPCHRVSRDTRHFQGSGSDPIWVGRAG
jgi:hypothetical protein